jgi:hypothetical protein
MDLGSSATRGLGHVAGILRWVGTEVVGDTDPGAAEDLGVVYDDNDTGWGINLTTVINVFERDAIRAGYVFGEGIASYMNDGGMDAGPDQGLLPDGSLPGGTKIEAVELTGLSLYYDHWWSDQWSSSAGYSYTEVDNTAGQTSTLREGSVRFREPALLPGAERAGRRRADLG